MSYDKHLLQGKKVVFAHAMYNLYDKWSDDKTNWEDVAAFGYFTLAGLAFWIPDPGTTLIGWLSPAKTPHAIAALAAIDILDDAGYFGKSGFLGRGDYNDPRFLQEEATTFSDQLDWLVRSDVGREVHIPIFTTKVGLWIDRQVNKLRDTVERRRFPSHGV